MEKNWQVSILVKGLVVPEEGIRCDEDFLIKRHDEAGDEAEVFMRITKMDAEDDKSFLRPFQKVLDRILQLYGLETGHYAVRYSGYGTAPITKEKPFGQLSRVTIKFQEIYPPKTVRKLSSTFKFAVREYRRVQNTFEDSSKAFIRHGLEYYYMALSERSVEKRVIDLFVALESLFSKDQEIRYRVSVRITSFLGFTGIERKSVFERVYDLYQKRSRIVHGVEKVDLSWEEVYELERYLRECFRIFLFLDEGKDKILDMLDASVYDDGIKLVLQKLIVDAYAIWKTQRYEEDKY